MLDKDTLKYNGIYIIDLPFSETGYTAGLNLMHSEQMARAG